MAQELTDLQAIRAQLALLEQEVRTRETWLADAAGLAPPAQPSILDCEDALCVLAIAFRKIGYAVRSGDEQLLDPRADRLAPRPRSGPRPSPGDGDGDGDGDDMEEQTVAATPLPLPPWRGGNGTADAAGERDTAVGKEEEEEEDDDMWEDRVVTFAAVLFLVTSIAVYGAKIVAYLARAYLDRRRRRRQRQRNLASLSWGEFGLGASGVCGVRDGEVPPRSGLEAEEAKDGMWEEWGERAEYTDESIGYPDGHLDEKKGRWGDGTEGDDDMSVQGELPSVEEELTSFRSAVDLVESLIAEQERRPTDTGRQV